MDDEPSGTESDAESPSVLAKGHQAKTFAIIALWSPFLAFIFTSVIMASMTDETLNERAFRTREMVIAAGGLLAAFGLASGWRALRLGRSVGYKGIFGRAVFGVTANALLVCLAILGVGAFMRLEKQLEKQKTQQQSPVRVSFEAATARLARTQKTLDRMATNYQGDAAVVAATSSDFLKQLRVIGDDYAAKTKLINLQLASSWMEVASIDALQAKERIASNYLEANDKFAAFSQTRNELYRQALVKAGVSTNAIETAVNAFRSQSSTQPPWEANRKLGQAHLTCLQFLETNWGKWSYTNDHFIFQTESLSQECSNLQAKMTRAYREVVSLQQRTNTPVEVK
jgi:hypothetical protein